MKNTFALLTMLLAFLPSVLTAQAKTEAVKASVVLVFVEDDLEMTIKDAAGKAAVVKEGMTIPVGSVITTLNTTAELQLRPNKSIIKLSAKTTFSIKALKEGSAEGSNDFLLAAGKIRTVAAKLTGATAPGYNVATPTANCGVRGTDFAMKFDPEEKMDWVCVQEGQVDFTNVVTGMTVPVATGQFANTFDEVFQAAAVDAARLAELFSDVDFVKLDPKDVTAQEIAPTTQEAPVETTPAEETAKSEAAADSPMMEMLKKLFGLEVGSISIQGTTYSKAVLSPVIAFDSFKLGLYLPIIYTTDMFNPQDWYRPEGNDEWSFGTDKTGIWDKTADAAQDLALKIKYLEWGVQGADPFYVKIGNLKTMSLGHGTIMRNFANDQDFPSVRKIGLNAGVKFGAVALEGMADDLAKASVVGGRIAVDLIGDQVAIGVQTSADLKLAADPTPGKTATDYGDPILLVGGADLQLFKINTSLLRATAFADANTLAVYYREDSAEYGLAKGLDLKPLFHDGKLAGFGGEAGFYGNIAIVDYRLSFQAEKGLYTNGIFQGNYYRTRNALLTSLGSYSSNTAFRNEADETLNMGVFGSFGFDVGIFSLDGAYRWPFELKADGSIGPADSDYLKIRVDIPKDKIPFVKLAGGFSYERTGFVPSLRDKVDLFDANTVVRGEVIYGLAKGMDLVFGVGTATKRNADGTVVYENNKPKVSPTVSIDTKVSL